MHIEVGILSAPEVASANAAAIATLAAHANGLWRRPIEIGKTLLAAVFFSLFMEVWHQPVGPSELHFIGASMIYFLFGFTPTLFGFAIGLALQALLFEPQDMLHLGVNALSLMVPLIAAHMLVGRRILAAGKTAPIAWSSVLQVRRHLLRRRGDHGRVLARWRQLTDLARGLGAVCGRISAGRAVRAAIDLRLAAGRAPARRVEPGSPPHHPRWHDRCLTTASPTA